MIHSNVLVHRHPHALDSIHHFVDSIEEISSILIVYNCGTSDLEKTTHVVVVNSRRGFYRIENNPHETRPILVTERE